MLPEDLRLMYLHLWCLGLRINEVCSIKREGYYVKEGGVWLRIYQHKMKVEKVIPIPMTLYRGVMVYVERKGIESDSYVFPNSKGGPYSSTHYWHDMVDWCNELGIRCGDHIFQTHDYRHSVATALYEQGARKRLRGKKWRLLKDYRNKADRIFSETMGEYSIYCFMNNMIRFIF